MKSIFGIDGIEVPLQGTIPAVPLTQRVALGYVNKPRWGFEHF